MYTQSRPLYRMLVVMLATIAFACGGESQEASVPADLAKIANLTTFSGDASPNVEINFEHELSLGDSPEQPIGRLGGFDVDDLGRMYVSDVQKNTLYIFEPDGDYITSVGESGRGPGEYMSGPFPRVKSDQLFLLDMMNSRVTQYSLADLELVRTIKINPMNKGSFEELSDATLNKIMIINEETFLVRLSTFIRRIPEDAGEIKDDKLIYFYLMGDDARLTGPLTEPVPLYELTGKSTPLMAKYTGRFSRGEPKPQIFTKPVVAASDNGYIFTAMSDQLLIRKYTTDGDYLSAFYHPFEHVEMSREDAISSQKTPFLANLVSQNEIPDTWPAMDHMLVDGEGRIWIATIVENLSVYEWWVLEDNGELITRFKWPRNEPIEVVKNGKMYTRQTDEETGLQQVVRYRIEMEEL